MQESRRKKNKENKEEETVFPERSEYRLCYTGQHSPPTNRFFLCLLCFFVV